MIKIKETYVSPITETLEVQFEGFICGSGEFGIEDWQNDGDPLSA